MADLSGRLALVVATATLYTLAYEVVGMERERERYYVKADLEDYADLDAVRVYDNENVVVKRSDILRESLGLSDDELHVYSSGGYQGSMVFVFSKGGFLWVLRDSYGSCSHCDGLLAADTAADYGVSMMRNAYAFESKNDAVRFVHQIQQARGKDDHELEINPYFWSRVDSQAVGLINDVRYP